MSRLTHDEAGALLAGLRGPVHHRYRLYESDVSGAVGAFVSDVQSGGGQASMSNFRDHTWEINLTRRELTGSVLARLGDYVRLFVEVHDPAASEWIEFPVGLYKLDPYTSSHEEWGSSFALAGRSPEVLFSEDYAVHALTVQAQAPILAWCRGLLVARGIPARQINFPGVDKVLGTPMSFDPFQDSSSTSYLRILNALLNAGGFYALYTDNEGRFTTKEIEALGSVEPDAIYTSGGELGGAYRFLAGTIEEEYDLESFANRVVVYSGDPNQAAPVVAVATNRDPNSPGSVQNLGRVVQGEPVMVQNVVSQSAANQLAAAQLKRDTAANHRVNFSTLPDPRRGPRENYRIEARRADGTAVVSGMWSVVGWTLPLGSPPEPMAHECTRRARLDVA